MSWIIAHWQEVLGAVTAILSGIIAVFMLIPGDAPEKQLQKIVDFIKKFSVKPADKEIPKS